MGLTMAGATALSAGLNFLGGMYSNAQNAEYNAQEAERNREFQERMYHQQVEDNIKFWNMQNEYNLPSAVYARDIQGLKENGLNPLLMYGNSGVSSIGTSQQAPQSANAPHGSQASTHFNNPVELANIALLEAQANLLNKQAQKTEKESENIGEQTTGLQFMNWLNDQTKNIQVAIRFRDYDRVNQLIDESRVRTFNMHEENARAWSQLSWQTNLAIRAQNLNEFQVGQNVAQGWEGLKIGRIQANAQLRAAAASWLQAKSAWNLSNAQIGVLRETATKLHLENDFYDKTMSHRIYQFNKGDKVAFWNAQNAMMNSLLIESNIRNVDSNTWLNSYRKDLMESQMFNYDMNSLMAPINALTSFGSNSSGGANMNGYQYNLSY